MKLCAVHVFFYVFFIVWDAFKCSILLSLILEQWNPAIANVRGPAEFICYGWISVFAIRDIDGGGL